MNVSVLAAVFHRQFSKNRQFQAKLLVFWNLLVKYNSYNRNVHRKIIRTYLCVTYHFLFIYCTFQNSAPIKNNKKRSEIVSIWWKCAIYLIFYKLIFFGSLIIFLEPTIKLITGIFDSTIPFCDIFFRKRIAP